jgi:putative oxygen-independent coproporphyrinogen III oxidase
MTHSLYVHIPFCNEICSYCDFCKVLYQSQWVDDYLDKLDEELYQKEENLLYTIYIGGGTPSSLSCMQLKRLMNMLKYYSYRVKEYTVEVNPESMNEEKLKILYDGGVTRLSIGVQTFQEELLEPLHRRHHNKDVFDLMTKAKEIGFQNISIDMMYGLPYQTQKHIQNDLQIIKSLDIQHISYYSLILEEHTLLDIQHYQPIDEEKEYYYSQMIKKALYDMDFIQYEVSNYAKNGYESLHNLVYWHYEDYDGIGLGAHGKVQNRHYENTRSLTQYLKGNFLKKDIELTKEDQMFETVMMGLRLVQGISLNHFFEKFNQSIEDVYGNVIQKHIENKLLKYENESLIATSKGLDLLHEVLIDFL